MSAKQILLQQQKLKVKKKLIQVIKRMGYSKEEAYAFFDSLGEIETEAQLTNALYRINELGKVKGFTWLPDPNI